MKTLDALRAELANARAELLAEYEREIARAKARRMAKERHCDLMRQGFMKGRR